jgi:hypothetical protein
MTPDERKQTVESFVRSGQRRLWIEVAGRPPHLLCDLVNVGATFVDAHPLGWSAVNLRLAFDEIEWVTAVGESDTEAYEVAIAQARLEETW